MCDLAEAHKQLAYIYSRKGNMTSALREYESAIVLNPCDPEPLYKMGWYYDAQGDFARAIAYYQKALACYAPQDEANSTRLSQLYLQLGHLFYRQGQYDNAAAMHQLGVGYYHRLDVSQVATLTQGAINELGAIEKALSFSPQEAWFHYWMGKADMTSIPFDRNISALQKAIALEPSESLFYQDLALIYSHRGEDDLAMATLQQAIALTPNTSDLYSELGKLIISSLSITDEAHLNMAIQAFNQAIRLNPSNTDYYDNLAWAYRGKKDYPAAIQTIEKAIALEPWNKDLYEKLGRLASETEDWAKATEALKNAHKLAPKDTSYYCDLAELYRKQGELILAVKNYQQAIALDTCGLYFEWLGDTYMEMGHPQKAAEAFFKALEDFLPADAETQALLAKYNQALQGSTRKAC